MRRLLSLGVLALTLLAAPAFAQPNLPTLPQPRLQSIFPPGAKAGTAVEVAFAGTDVEEPVALLFSHPGLTAEVVPPPPPPPPDPNKPMPNPPPKPPITKFKVTVAPDTPLGGHDVRLVNKWGISNPRLFVVGDRDEIEEKEPNNDVAQARKVELNTVVNGIINAPTDVDYFTFTGQKGQRVLVYVATSSIDSRLKPGLELFDAAGNQLVYTRPYRDRDVLADFLVPADGDYLLRLHHVTYTGGNADFFYRLTLTTGPWIDAIVPPMIEPGQSAQVTIYGRNLPGGQPDPTAVDEGRVLEKITATVTAPADPQAAVRLTFGEAIWPMQSSQDGFEYRLTGPGGSSNPYLMFFARGPVAVETEPNDKPDAPQEFAVPGELAGRIDKRDDRDWYRFSAKKGDVFIVELFGDRLHSPADFYISIKPADPKAGPIVEGDDTNESLHPFQFFTRTNDPQPLRFEAKEDGAYLLLVSARDAGTEYGPRHLYRLRMTREQPDFRLIVMPDTPLRPEAGLLRAGGELAFDVFIWWHDGFKEPLTLSVDGLPEGVTCPPQLIAPNQKQATLVLSAAADAKPAIAALTVTGTATLNGQPLVRHARSATITWLAQENQPALCRLDRQMLIAVRDKPPLRLTVKETALKIKQGDKATVNVVVERLWEDFKAQVQVTASTGAQPNQPLIPNVQFAPVTIAPDKTEAQGTITVAANAVPGVYSYVLRASAQHQYEKEKGKKVNTGINHPALPLMLTIVPKDLGTISASAGNLKIGTPGEIVVKVNRTNNYTGEYKIAFTLPEGTTGITLPEASIPAGAGEVKVPVTLADDAQPGAIQNVVVKATAMFDPETPIISETKINLNVVK